MSRRVAMIAGVTLVAVLAIWYLLLWKPTKSDLDKAKQRRATAESQQQQLQSEIARLQEAQRNEPATRAKLERFRAAIPDDPDLGNFILNVNDAATKSGIDFISLSPAQPKPPARNATVTATTAGTTGSTTATTAATGAAPTASVNAPAEITLALSIQGGYFQVLDFINRLTALPRLVVIDSLTVSAGGTTTKLSVAISARMFVRQVPTGFAGAPSTTTTTAAGGSTTTTGPGGATTTTAAGGATTTTAAGGTTTTVAP